MTVEIKRDKCDMICYEGLAERKYKFFAVFFLLLFISGCAQFTHISKKDSKVAEINFVYKSSEIDDWPDINLKNAFSVYWHKRFSGGPPGEIYSYEAPHFQKMAAYSRYEAYLNNLPKADILRIEIAYFLPVTGFLYEIPATIVFKNPDGHEQTMSILDRWVWVDDQWYHVLRDPLAFPKTG